MNSKQLENWADRLLIEYEEGRKQLYRMKEKLDPNSIEDQEDKKIINSMINDMSFSIEWLKKGRRPGNLRGVDKRSAYQRRVLIDMDLLPALDVQPEERTLTQEEREAIIDILIDLSHRERQCYLLHFANGWSMQEIADELNISKSAVQIYINRAKEKIKKKTSCYTNVI